MRKKLVYLPDVYSKEIVESINIYFDRGYDIENILNANNGYYILLVLKGNENYNYVGNYKTDDMSNLIEENKESIGKWVKTSTGDIVPNTSTGDALLN